MSSKGKKASPYFPWRKHLKAGLRQRQPDHINAQWLHENRWWWRHVPQAIKRHAETDFPSFKSDSAVLIRSIEGSWRSVQLSAFLYELGRRCEPKKRRSWLELSNAEITGLACKWPDKQTSAGLDAPFIFRPFETTKEWLMEPVATYKHPKDSEVLWNKNEPAWTDPYAVAANLNLGDKAIIERFKEWLADERKRTGIPSPRGGSTQGIGKNLWRFIEVLDKRNAGLGLDEVENSLCSKAKALWRAVETIPRPYTAQFWLRVALRDIPKHGRILESSLPKISAARVVG